jgi:type 1 glutamine amidotransferase
LPGFLNERDFKLKVLLLCNEHYHPGQVAIDGVAPLKGKGYEFDIIENGHDFKPEMLKNYPVVLLVKCAEASPEDKSIWKTAEVQKAFVEYVENGGGLLAVHNALVPGEDTDMIDKLVGSRFKWHPKDCPVTVEPIKDHPVTKGVGAFCEVDEHYYLENLVSDADIIMASYSPAQGEPGKPDADPYTNCPAKIEPAGYVRTQGKGRVCVLTSGHHLKVWHNPNFQKALDNALTWCSGK